MEAIHVNHPEFKEYWKKGEGRPQGSTFFYTEAFRRYSAYYLGSKIVHDDSFVVASPRKEVLALVPLYAVAEENGALCYRHGADYLRAPLFFCPSEKSLFKETTTFVFKHVEECAQKHSVKSYWAAIEAAELLEGRLFFNDLMDYDFNPQYGVTNIIDVGRPAEEMWASLRQSNKPMINRAKKNCRVKIVDSRNYDFGLCEEYRKLHHLAAGRVTRSLESFTTMYDVIKEGKAFLVLVFDHDGQARGAHLFFYNGLYAYSASAATDPSLPDHCGIGHLAVWEGMLFAKTSACRFLDLGALMHQHGLTPSSKELNIDSFKRGFGGIRVTVFRGIKNFTIPSAEAKG